MKISKGRVLTVLGVTVAMLSLAGAGSAALRGDSATKAPTTLIYAGASDPTFLDPMLTSDGESFRVTKQIFEGLVDLKPGSTAVGPKLALSLGVDKTGKVWTFQLRHGVKFQDGTAFNAKAVCFNFNRWYNFSAPFQNAGATFYYQAIFLGFHHNDPANSSLRAPVYKSCKAKGSYTAAITLTKKYGPFLPALSLSSFAMQSPAALTKYGADQGTINNGAFAPTGTYAFQHPTGTGPFKFSSWTVKQKVVLVRNDKYWGTKAKLKQIVIVPIADNSARVQALQTGEVNAMDLLQPSDVSQVQSNSNLKTIGRPAFNVAYVGINQAKPPMDKLAVRQAVAYGLNRQAVVNTFYAGRAQVANEFMPPSLFGYAKDVVKYSFDPAKAKQLLQSAGLTLPVSIDFYYPTGVSRPYMPDPAGIFQVYQQSLDQSGFKVVPHSEPWRPQYVADVNAGTAGHLNLIGWTGDYGDPDDFIGVFFKAGNPQFGFSNAALTNLLNKGAAETNFAKRVSIYQQANRMIMKDILPGVPYAHTKPALGFQKSVQGYIASPTGSDPFAPVYFGGQ
jgi:peptide/nickel transport system substrate-binding protein